MEQRENQRIMLTRRLIKESLIRLLAQESIHKVSIRALCEDAGINRSTFYKYYGSQYDVLSEMETELIQSIQSALDEGPFDEDGRRYQMGVICAYVERNMDAVQLLVGNNADPAFPERLFDLPQIRQMIGERLAGRYDGESQAYIYAFISHGCYRLIQEWLSHAPRKPFSQVALLLEELIDRACG